MKLFLTIAFQGATSDGPNWLIVAIGVVIVVGLATAFKSRGGIGATGVDESLESDRRDLL